MKKSVKVDLSWRAWSLIVGFFILIGFVGLSFAYNANGIGGNPAIMGHSADEIAGGVGGTTIISSCLPDYSAMSSISWGTTTTKTVDGYLYLQNDARATSSTLTIGSQIFKLTSWNTDVGVSAGGTMYIIPANTAFTISGSASGTAKFYPCKSSSESSAGNADYVIESGKSADGNSWYRKWKSGWIEQGGVGESIAGNTITPQTITFSKPFTQLSFSITTSVQSTAYTFEETNPKITAKTLNSFSYITGAQQTSNLMWEAKGY